MMRYTPEGVVFEVDSDNGSFYVYRENLLSPRNEITASSIESLKRKLRNKFNRIPDITTIDFEFRNNVITSSFSKREETFKPLSSDDLEELIGFSE